MQNRYLYQGDFSEYDGETEYNEFDLRHYDAQTGRWTTADPYQQFASPYLGMGNSPGGMVDPDGGSVLDYFRNARGEVFWSNSTAETVFENGELWMNIGKSYWGDQVGGYITHWLEGGASEMFKVMPSSVAQINPNFTAFGDLTAIRLETLAKQIAAYNALDHAHGQVAEPLNWFERNFIYDNSQRGFTGIDPVSGNYLVNTGVDTKGYLTYKPQITEYYKGGSPFGAVGPAGGFRALKAAAGAAKGGTSRFGQIRGGIQKAQDLTRSNHNLKLLDGKRIDLKGRHPLSKGHYNKVTKEQLGYPHVYDPAHPGGVRAPNANDYIEIFNLFK